MAYSIGKTIKGLRVKYGLSQESLAEKLNSKFGTSINKGMLSKWENGLGDPRLETVRHLAIYFDLSLDYLLGLEREENTPIAEEKEEDTWSEEELKEIERFKEFIKSKRSQQV